jgi:hypothetical protein
VLGSAPRASGERPRLPAPEQLDGSCDALALANELVAELVDNYREQLRRALSVELDDTTTSLAFVDHHLKLARQEDRAPILSLLAASAGAYYGELVRETIGARWIGDGRDPRRLRLLVTPQFLHFSPIDQAFEAIVAGPLDEDDERRPAGAPLDTAFHLRPPKSDRDDDEQDDAVWLQQRLSELALVPEDEFYSLTCRFETLQLMLELLAAKHAAEGRAPHELSITDYLEVLGGAS